MRKRPDVTAKLLRQTTENRGGDVLSAPLVTTSAIGFQSRGRFTFGEFGVDLDRGSLSRRGKEISLRPKSFAVLLYLLEHAGQLVAREELLAAVWPDLVVTDDSLAQCLIDLRKALGDESRSMIRTVPRRGLIFDIPVRFEDTVGPPASHPMLRAARPGWMLVAGLAVVAVMLLWWGDSLRPATPSSLTDRKSVAVLRFADMSAPGGRSYLADGFSEEIMHMLAQSPSLNVIARSSSFAMEGESIDTVASRLGVSHVLEGSVRRQDNRIRVAAQLVDAETSSHVWSKSFDREPADIMEVQKEIATSVAQALVGSLVEQADAPAIDARAYELFLEAQFFYHRRAAGDTERAEKRLQDALAIDPEFARAWAALAAVAAARLGDPHPRLEDPDLRAHLKQVQKRAAEQALRFGPDLPEAHHRVAQYYFYNGDRRKALEHLKAARSIDPDHRLVLVALINDLRYAGRIEESNRFVRFNIRRDPLSVDSRANLVWGLFWAGHFGNIGSELDKILDLNPSIIEEVPRFGWLAAQANLLQQDFDAVLTVIESMPESIERTQARALVRHGQGREVDSVAALEQLASMVGTGTEMILVAEVYAYREQPSKALEWLNRIEVGPACDDFLLWSIYYSPFLRMLGNDPGWGEFRSEVFELMHSCRLGVELDSRAT